MADSALQFSSTETVAVGTSVLRVGGASSWTAARALTSQQEWYTLTNCDAAKTVYLGKIAVGASVTGAISSTDYQWYLGPGQTIAIHIDPKCDLCVLASSASANVRLTREVDLGYPQ